MIYQPLPLPLPRLSVCIAVGGGPRGAKKAGGSRFRGRSGGGYSSPAEAAPPPSSGHYATLGVKSNATTAEVGNKGGVVGA